MELDNNVKDINQIIAWKKIIAERINEFGGLAQELEIYKDQLERKITKLKLQDQQDFLIRKELKHKIKELNLTKKEIDYLKDQFLQFKKWMKLHKELKEFHTIN